ncbi:MAG: hypothetical protein E3J43_06615 [Candidatus Heimdallarchaeota archaeon]|nr:MAG: hypothetical protein E3J43_06615 [Candidatus Heimdallarchaeota archaeon]
MAFSGEISAQIRTMAGTFTAIQTYEDGCLRINDDDDSNYFVLTGTLSANRVVTLPDNDIDLSVLDSAELQFLSDLQDAGVTVTELDKLDGYLGSVTELNYLKDLYDSGVAVAELDKLDGYLGGVTELNYLKDIYDTGVTASELNTLDGITSTVTELNKLDGFTGTKDDLNYVKDLRSLGVTVAELDKLDGYLGSVTELNYLKDLYDEGVTKTEFNYLDGVTSDLQTQLNLLLASLYIGIGNADYIPTVYLENASAGRYYYINNGVNILMNVNGTDVACMFLVHLPTNRAGKKLYITGVRVGTIDADGINAISDRYIIGIASDGNDTVLDTNPDDISTITTTTDETMNIDCSSYAYILIKMSTTVQNAGALEFSFPEVKIHYA